MIISAYLGVPDLVGVGYRFYDASEVAIGSRVTAGILQGASGYYSANATVPANAVSVRWDSTGDSTAIAVEYFDLQTVDLTSVNTALSNLSTQVGNGFTTVSNQVINGNTALTSSIDSLSGVIEGRFNSVDSVLSGGFSSITGRFDNVDSSFGALAGLLETILGISSETYTNVGLLFPAIDAIDTVITNVYNQVEVIGGELPEGLSDAIFEIQEKIMLGPPEDPIQIIPGPPPGPDECLVFGYVENIGNKIAGGVYVEFELVRPEPTKSERIIAGRKAVAQSNHEGLIKILLQRNDRMVPPGSKYWVTSEQLGFRRKEMILTGPTFDLITLIEGNVSSLNYVFDFSDSGEAEFVEFV